MPDINLNVKIVDAKVAKLSEGFLKLYPNAETIPDPEWVAPDPNPDNEVAPQIPKYATTKAFVEAWISDKLINEASRGLNVLKREAQQIEDLTGAVVPQ